MLYLLRIFVFFIIFFLSVFKPVSGLTGEFSAQKANFSLCVQDIEIPYKLMSIFVMPEEKIKMHITEIHTKSLFFIYSSHGQITQVKKNQWKWIAPRFPGHYTVTVSGGQNAGSILLNIFVMVPREHKQGEYLNGYRIGRYPHILFKGLPNYGPPVGFVEVTAANAETLVSPHFRLKQFLCNQNSEYPKYIVLKENLLLKLELILSEVNARGYPCDTFHVMSGYRTPHYNKSIGNVKYSRHIFGGAADIFIDEYPKDKMMDDLNRDGKMDYKDAAILYEIIDNLYGKPFYQGFEGGLARYKKKANHGPFVHIDVRGRRARWGD